MVPLFDWSLEINRRKRSGAVAATGASPDRGRDRRKPGVERRSRRQEVVEHSSALQKIVEGSSTLQLR
jgi:hypothetical protein